MNKKLDLNALNITSFVTAPDDDSKGGAKVLGDGTIVNCHCPTYACSPSAEAATNCCW